MLVAAEEQVPAPLGQPEDLVRHFIALAGGPGKARIAILPMATSDAIATGAEKKAQLKTSEDVVVNRVGRELYEKFFRNYTRKQWGMDPSELDASVTARVPVRTNRDNRYFTDTYQAMPLHGFTRMFENMLDHPNIKIMLQSDFRELEQLVPYKHLIYTGPIDEFFDFEYGKLPYRSLELKHETINKPVFQPEAVVNYPNEHPYTRVTEFKYLTGQEHPKTSVVYEFSRAEGDPYYPVPRPENNALYKKYKALADAQTGVYFVGRLATYKYFNMDQVTAQGLTVFKQIVAAGEKRIELRTTRKSMLYPAFAETSVSVATQGILNPAEQDAA